MLISRKSSCLGVLMFLMAMAVTGSVGGYPASAEQSRRAARRAAPPPVAPSHAAPDVTGTIKGTTPAPAMPVTPAIKKDEDEGPLKPFDLPTAPRARMRQCGESWQKIKMSGQAGDRTWREFATACLAERAATSSASPRDTSINSAR